MSENLVSLQHLKLDLITSRGLIHAVRDINLDIRAGETHGIVGESGCGKTMTAKSIFRLHDEKRPSIREKSCIIQATKLKIL